MTENIEQQLNGKRVLITGGAGMIGSSVAQLVCRCGADVTILDAMLPMYGGNRFNLHGLDVKFVQDDIRNAAVLPRLVADKDYIFNLAAQVSYVDSNTDPFLDLDINCRGHLNLLEACRSTNSRAKVVFSSSRFVYGRIEQNPVNENHPFNCRSIYGIHKLAGEKYHLFYNDAYDIPAACVRIANPYGPRQQMKHSKYGIVNWFVRLALEGKPLTIYGDGQQARDYVYVDDIALGMVMVALSPVARGKVLNIGSGIGIPFVDMARIIVSHLPGTTLELHPWPAARYFVETGDYITDTSAITAVTGWMPQISLEEGLLRTIEFYTQYRDHYW